MSGVRFATTFDPNGPEVERWTPFNEDNEAYLDFCSKIAAKTRLRMEKVDLIRRSFEARRNGAGGSTVIDAAQTLASEQFRLSGNQTARRALTPSVAVRDALGRNT